MVSAIPTVFPSASSAIMNQSRSYTIWSSCAYASTSSFEYGTKPQLRDQASL